MHSKVWWILLGSAFLISASPPVPQALTLNGRPFPAVAPYTVRIPTPQRTLAVSPSDDLQAALCGLVAGDQLRINAGTYKGNFQIDERCHDGPISVVFDPKAVINGSLSIRRSNWHVSGLFLKNGGVSVEGSSVVVNRARVQGDLKVSGNGVTISNSNSLGIEVTARASHIMLVNNHVHDAGAGCIRVNGARNVDIIGNTIRRSDVAAIAISDAEDINIADNTIEDTNGIALEQVKHATIRSNHIADAAVGVAVGRLSLAADDVTIDHNDIESTSPAGVAVSIEAGNRILLANNVIEGYANGILVLGKRPQARNVTVVNNLILGVSATAFVIRDPSAIRLFDFNVFSPANDPVKAEIGPEKLTLAQALARGSMPNTRQVTGVHLLQRDLGRIAGVETVDRGTRVGIAFKGRAPDLGVNEQ